MTNVPHLTLEQWHQILFDQSADGIFVADSQGNLLEVNRRGCEMLRWNRDELVGLSIKTLIPTEDLAHDPLQLDLPRTGKTLLQERRLRRKDGRLLTAEIRARGLPDGSLMGIVRDVSKRVQTLEALRTSEERLQLALKAAHMGEWDWNIITGHVEWSQRCKALYGLPDDTPMSYERFLQALHPDDRERIDSALRRAVHERTDYDEFKRTVWPDGSIHWTASRGQLLCDVAGRPVRMVGVSFDISDWKEAERAHESHLWFLESLDQVNRIIQRTSDLEEATRCVLDTVLSVFDSDRAFLLYPCDPESPTWFSPMERCKPEYPGVFESNRRIPMDPQVAEALRILLATDGPAAFGPGLPHDVPEYMVRKFAVRSAMAMAIYPKIGRPWQFGIHQCSDVRRWTTAEKRLFQEIGRRLEDGLTSQLSSRDLRNNERFLDNIVEHIPNMIFVKDAQTLSFVRFNKAGEQLLGYPREELLGKSDHDFFPKKEADFFVEKDRQVLDSKELLDIPEETVRTRSNEVRILHTKKLPILDESGTPQYLLGISEDITERRQAEESIRKLSQAIEQSPVSIVITDTEGSIEFVNAKFSQITGYTYAEAMGQNPRILKSGETPAEEYSQMWQTISSGGVWQGEFHNRKKSGELFWEQATIAPVRSVDNVITHYVAVKEDITEQKRLEDRMRQGQKLEAVGQLAGGVAHDFNNMLGVIIGHAELALRSASEDVFLRRNLEAILTAASRSADVTRQLLAFARKQAIAPKVLDLNETVEGMLKLLRRLIGEDIDLVWLPGPKIHPVKMDPSQVDQIMANLCVNARDAIAGVGKITIETHNVVLDEVYCAEREGLYAGEYVMLAVSDDGDGMDQWTMEKIFEPFFTTKGLGQGTGLGLATVYGIVRQNNGCINVDSELRRGSSFKIYLPREVVKNGETGKEGAVAAPRGGNETVLLVEDEAAVLEMARLMLKGLGYVVLSASTPGEAIRIARDVRGEIDLLITDVVMPGMKGQELAERLIEMCPEQKVLFMSGYTSRVVAEQVVLDESVKFIQKPFSTQELAVKVREVLDGN